MNIDSYKSSAKYLMTSIALHNGVQGDEVEVQLFYAASSVPGFTLSRDSKEKEGGTADNRNYIPPLIVYTCAYERGEKPAFLSYGRHHSGLLK